MAAPPRMSNAAIYLTLIHLIFLLFPPRTCCAPASLPFLLQAIHHALSSPYPRTRYPVAKINRADVGVVFLVRMLLPDRMFDHKFLLNC